MAVPARNIQTSDSELHADDRRVPVLDPGRGKTSTGRLWTYVREDRPAALAGGVAEGCLFSGASITRPRHAVAAERQSAGASAALVYALVPRGEILREWRFTM